MLDTTFNFDDICVDRPAYVITRHFAKPDGTTTKGRMILRFRFKKVV